MASRESSDRRAQTAELAAAQALGMESFLPTKRVGPAHLGQYNGRLVKNYESDLDGPIVHGLSWLMTREVGEQELSERIAYHAVSELVGLGRYDVLSNPEFYEELENLALATDTRKKAPYIIDDILYAAASAFIDIMKERGVAPHPDSLASQAKLHTFDKHIIALQVFGLFKQIARFEESALESVQTPVVSDHPMRARWDEAWACETGNETMSILVTIPRALQDQFGAEDRKQRELANNVLDKRLSAIFTCSALDPVSGIFRPIVRPEGSKDPSELQQLRVFMLAIPGLHPTASEQVINFASQAQGGRTETGLIPGFISLARDSARFEKA